MTQELDYKINNGLDIKYLQNKFNNLIDNVKNNFFTLPWSRYYNYLEFIDDYKDHNFKSISVVISNWERNTYIPYTIYQICNQDYPKELIEIIIVDQGSNNFLALQNNCKLLSEQYPDIKMRYFQHYSDPLENCRIRRNTGIRFSQNDIILMIESDTIFLGNNYFKIISWEFTKNLKSLVIPMVFDIKQYGDYLETDSLGQIEYPYIKTLTNDWVPDCLVNNKVVWDVYARLDHDFCNAFSRELIQGFKGFPENWFGYGGIEYAFYIKWLNVDIRPQYNFNLLSLQLFNFPYKLSGNLKIGDYSNCHSVLRDVDDWGTTDGMKEIDLYK